jgi:lysophospholipase L1-like esterase
VIRLRLSVGAFGHDARMTVLLVGDSNLALLCDKLPDLVPQAFGADVECRAAGGAWSGSLRHQIGDRAPSDYEAVVVSIGSSDSHPPYGSSPAIFRENLARELGSGGRWIALLPRDLLRALDPATTDEINARIRTYSGILAELVTASGGIALDVGAITGTPAPAAYDDDGIHLTREAYEKLVPEIANAIKQGGRAMR